MQRVRRSKKRIKASYKDGLLLLIILRSQLSTYTSWIPCFDEGEGSCSGLAFELC